MGNSSSNSNNSTSSSSNQSNSSSSSSSTASSSPFRSFFSSSSSSSSTPSLRCSWCGISLSDSKEQPNLNRQQQNQHSQQFHTCNRCGGAVKIKLKKLNSNNNPTATNNKFGMNSLKKSTSSSSPNSPSHSHSLLSDRDEEETKSSSLSSNPSNSSLSSEELRLQEFYHSIPLQRVYFTPFIETLPQELNHYTEREIIENYIQPYFQLNSPLISRGIRLQIKEIDFEIISCFPPIGSILINETQLKCCMKPYHALSNLIKIHILPVQSTIPNELKLDSDKIFTDYIRPIFQLSNNNSQPRHLSEGDTIMSKGIQFKVIACNPSDGIVTADTEIFTDGNPLNDLLRIHILPIYESLPNNEKSISSELLFEKYLAPHFSGRFQFITKGDKIEIDGVDFKILAAEPESGIVTLKTMLFAEGEPLRAEDLRRQQEIDDAEMARQLQASEDEAEAGAGAAPASFSGGFEGFPGLAVARSGSGGIIRQPIAMHSGEEMRARLAELLRVIPPNDRHRPIIQRLYDQVLFLPSMRGAGVGAGGAGNAILLDPRMFGMMRSAVGPPAIAGASEREIESLPTRIYESKQNNEAATHSEMAKANSQCMICLSDYEDRDVIRTLPCFHAFHAPCLSTWLLQNPTCPTCRYSIRGNNESPLYS